MRLTPDHGRSNCYRDETFTDRYRPYRHTQPLISPQVLVDFAGVKTESWLYFGRHRSSMVVRSSGWDPCRTNWLVVRVTLLV